MHPAPLSTSSHESSWDDETKPNKTLCLSPDPALSAALRATPWDRPAVPAAPSTLGTMMMPAVAPPVVAPGMPPPGGSAALGFGGTVVIEADAMRAARARIEAAIAAGPRAPAPLEPEPERAECTLVEEAGVRTMIGSVDVTARGAEQPYVINAIVDAPASSRSFVSTIPPAAQYAKMVSRAMRSDPPPSRRRILWITGLLLVVILAALTVFYLSTSG